MALGTGSVQWENGKPFIMSATGQKTFLSPLAAIQYSDPQVKAWAQSQGANIGTQGDGASTTSGAPKGSFLHGAGEWDTDQGKYVQHLNGGNLMDLGIAGFLAAPAIAGAVGSAGVAGAADTAGMTAGADATGAGAGAAAAGAGSAAMDLGPSTAANLAGMYGAGSVPAGIAGAGAAGAGTNSILASLMGGNSMFGTAGMIPTALQGIGALYNANAQGKQQGITNQLQQAQLIAQFLNSQNQTNVNQDTSQANTGLAATQLDPYAQQKDLNSANVKRSFAAGLQPNGQFSGSFDMSALSPDSLASGKSQFDTAKAVAAPNTPITDDASAEKLRQLYANYQNQNRNTLSKQVMDYLTQATGSKS